MNLAKAEYKFEESCGNESEMDYSDDSSELESVDEDVSSIEAKKQEESE